MFLLFARLASTSESVQLHWRFLHGYSHRSLGGQHCPLSQAFDSANCGGVQVVLARNLLARCLCGGRPHHYRIHAILSHQPKKECAEEVSFRIIFLEP